MTRVLLAEEEPLLREILVEGLVDEGFDVEAAVDGLEALVLYRAHGLQAEEQLPAQRCGLRGGYLKRS